MKQENKWLDANIKQLEEILLDDIEKLKYENIKPKRIVLSDRAQTILNESDFRKFDKSDDVDNLSPSFRGINTEYHPDEEMENLYYIVYEMPKGICYRHYPNEEVKKE